MSPLFYVGETIDRDAQKRLPVPDSEAIGILIENGLKTQVFL